MKWTATVTLIFVLAGCGDATPAPSATSAPTPTLKVGHTHEAAGRATTLIEVDYPFTGDEKHVAPEGSAFVGLDVKQCNDGAGKPTVTGSNSDWSLVGATGVVYTGTKDVAWTDWPLPKFPEASPLEPGTCSYGWVLLQVPGNEQFSVVRFKAPDATATASWSGSFVRN